MAPRLDHIGLDVSDYETSKAFYEKALAPLGMRVLMEPVPEVGGFGDDAAGRKLTAGRGHRLHRAAELDLLLEQPVARRPVLRRLPWVRGAHSAGVWQTASMLLPSGSSTNAP